MADKLKSHGPRVKCDKIRYHRGTWVELSLYVRHFRTMSHAHIRTTVTGFVVIACAMTVGCASNGDSSDDARGAAAAVIAAMTSGGRDRICIDNRTRGEPLAIFRSMTVAPDPARRPLTWQAPNRFGAAQDLSAAQLIDAEFAGNVPVLAEPPLRDAALGIEDQLQINALARQLATRTTSSVSLGGLTVPANASVRWWPFNRLSRSCDKTYRLTDPVVIRDVAFVSVTSGHWGTTFAVRRTGGQWQPWAQWSDWLY
jgi:hypothetical protein